MAKYSFVSPFHEAKFCGVHSYVLNKLRCAAGEENIAEHCFNAALSFECIPYCLLTFILLVRWELCSYLNTQAFIVMSKSGIFCFCYLSYLI